MQHFPHEVSASQISSLNLLKQGASLLYVHGLRTKSNEENLWHSFVLECKLNVSDAY